MSGFEHYGAETRQLEIEIERKGIILEIDWQDAVRVRELARRALDFKPGDVAHECDDPEHRALCELFGLAQLMLTVMAESAAEGIHTHGGPTWKAFARALWAEHAARRSA